MIALFQWSRLCVGLAAPLLAWLLVAGRASPRRTAVRVSLAAALALLVSAPMSVVDLQFLLRGPPNHNLTLLSAVRASDDLFTALAGVLALAAWALLLAAAARAGTTRRLVVFVTVLALALALQAALYYRLATPVILLEQWLDGTTWGLFLHGFLDNVAAAAALACALLLPPDSPAGETGA